MEHVIFPALFNILYLKEANVIQQYFNQTQKTEECELISEQPFVISSNGIKYLVVREISDENVQAFDYVLYASKKPTKRDFEAKALKIRRWIKNPLFISLSPNDVNDSWKDKFKFVKEEPENHVDGLRPPQIGALYSILAHFQNAEDRGIIVMPTGTGKTETMLCTLIANRCKKILVAVPSDSLRNQLAVKFLTLGLLKKFGVVDQSCQNPIVGIINSNFQELDDLKEFVSKVNVVVTTMTILTSGNEETKDFITTEFSNLFVDEAHHSEAETWKEFIGRFKKDKVLLFTATPYRNDGKKLDGKFIFEFSLRKAQEQRYYKKINLLPVREYNRITADKAIANKAVEQLRLDIAEGYNHILMARCKSKERAKEVYEYYKQHEDLKPILIHSDISSKRKILEEIKRTTHKIIVCVNMLGEGFDLPQLKIAAIHDERQSLAVTLQFIGRFTRPTYDELGVASFVTNLAYPPIEEEIEQLYAKDADWNLLLPIISTGATENEINFKEFLAGFTHLENSIIPFQDINPAMSTVIYKNGSDEWKPTNWEAGISNLDSYEHQYSDYNPERFTLVIILGKILKVDWGTFDTVQNLEWNIIIVFWDRRPDINRIFINTSLDNFSSKNLVCALFGEANSIISGMDVFRIFHEIHQLTLFTVGVNRRFGKDVSFQSFLGRAVGDGIKMIEQKGFSKNNVFGVGYKDGEKVTLGCSIKGKIWSYLRGNLNDWTKWCAQIGDVVEDTDIDPNTVLKHTIQPKPITTRPLATPTMIEWNEEMLLHSERHYVIVVDGKAYDLSDSELCVIKTSVDELLKFEFRTDDISIVFNYLLGEKNIDGATQFFFEIKQETHNDAIIKYGKKIQKLEEFLNEHSPTIYFADYSKLYRYFYFEFTEDIPLFPQEELISDTWLGVSLNKESQGVIPLITDSIQYYFISKIQDEFDIIYDDDGSGEIADIVAMNNFPQHIDIHLYHLKFAKEGKVSNDIDNFYQVCGQAQKSLKWKYKKGKEIFEHMFQRIKKSKDGNTIERLLKGTPDELEKLLNAAKWNKDLRFHVYIVQPSLSKANPSDDILILLGNTSHYLHTVGNVELKVYTSA